jgi:Tol biopolymer transport system component
VPAVRPQGDWILFHSWRGHRITLGSPGYGGLGSALWIMRPDGSHVAELTGTDASKGGGEGEDDYHAYWSPDGRHVVWAHLNWDFLLDRGSGRWDIRVADFVVHAGVPALVNERVVRPANGHWYETQWWAPDGSGFLYTETYGTAMNTELFFCRLTAAGCTVTRLTDNPGWDEQAIFTPDGKNVIWMSSRDHPGVFNTFSTLAQDAGLTTDEDYLLTLPVFEAAFEQPVAAEATDLYELNLASGAVRRLTTDGDDGWVTPEFTWDPTHRFLLWTELRIADGVRAPLPVDAIRQLKQLAAYLSHPSVPNVGGGNLLGALVPLESRTREGRFR